MTTITIGKNETFLLVPFNILQATANSLRKAGVAINVKKAGEYHRILIQKKPEGFCITQLIQSLSLTETTTQASPSATPVETSVSNNEISQTDEGYTTQAVEEPDQQLTQETGREAAPTLPFEPESEIGSNTVTAETEEKVPTTEATETVKVEPNDASVVADEATMATLEQLEQQSLEQLQQWAKAHSIPGYSKMKTTQTLAKKLVGKVTAVELPQTELQPA